MQQKPTGVIAAGYSHKKNPPAGGLVISTLR